MLTRGLGPWLLAALAGLFPAAVPAQPAGVAACR